MRWPDPQQFAQVRQTDDGAFRLEGDDDGAWIESDAVVEVRE